MADLQAVVRAGAFSVVIECTRHSVAAALTAASPIPTIGIGSGHGTCHGEVSVFRTSGNKYGHIVLRGGQGPNYEAEYIAFLKVAMKKAGLPPQIIIDCSHANSGKRYDRQKKVFNNVIDQIAAGEKSIVGMMLESHLCEGRQDISAGRKPLPNVSVTDGCIGWQETEELIRYAYNKL